MRLVIQRVGKSKLYIEGKLYSQIGVGLLLFLGIEEGDQEQDIIWLCRKVNRLRIFNDQNKTMNLSIHDINGEILVVSQFTLLASTKKGNRPSYINSAKPETAEPIYHRFIYLLEKELSKSVQTGKFGANMQIELVNDGPVTIIIDSKNKE